MSLDDLGHIGLFVLVVLLNVRVYRMEKLILAHGVYDVLEILSKSDITVTHTPKNEINQKQNS